MHHHGICVYFSAIRKCFPSQQFPAAGQKEQISCETNPQTLAAPVPHVGFALFQLNLDMLGVGSWLSTFLFPNRGDAAALTLKKGKSLSPRHPRGCSPPPALAFPLACPHNLSRCSFLAEDSKGLLGSSFTFTNSTIPRGTSQERGWGLWLPTQHPGAPCPCAGFSTRGDPSPGGTTTWVTTASGQSQRSLPAHNPL